MPWTVVAIAMGVGAVMAIPRGKPCPGLQSIGNTGMSLNKVEYQLFLRALPFVRVKYG
jgi:hypothetical protein